MGEILINQLFAGAYLQEGTNIGHEVINLFKDDNNDNYLFVTPSGAVKNHDVERILFVQNIKARETMEVIMKADGLTKTSVEDISKIYYAGNNIVDIFKKNLYHGEKDSVGIEIMATYKASNVVFPKNGTRIILTVDKDYIADDDNTLVIFLNPNKQKIVGQGMRTYLSEISYPDIYDVINELLNDNSKWEKDNNTQKMISDGSLARNNISFLEIIRKENDELIMSNLLAYYFNYNHRMFSKFTNEVMGINDFSISFEIIRESMNNIDLWVQDENNIIVIENKIKSGINGRMDDGTSQLDKYADFAEKYKRDNKLGNVFYFLFVPNYNNLSRDISKLNVQYKIINYSEIYDFFRKNAAEYINDKYFSDFLSGLKNQTMAFSELRFSIMRSRFLEKINQI